jgi:hypothetical protein
MRNAAFQRRMTLLAIAAMLLLALLPTAGRLLSAGSEGPLGSAWAQMCTMSGLKLVKIAPDGTSNPAIPKPGSGDFGASDCAYCPLLNTLATSVLFVALALPMPALRSWPQRQFSQRAIRRHPCGLGSRGPPGRFRISA